MNKLKEFILEKYRLSPIATISASVVSLLLCLYLLIWIAIFSMVFIAAACAKEFNILPTTSSKIEEVKYFPPSISIWSRKGEVDIKNIGTKTIRLVLKFSAGGICVVSLNVENFPGTLEKIFRDKKLKEAGLSFC